jgi:hypothetical protein
MAVQPVTYRPVTAIRPVTRKPDQDGPRKVTERKRPGKGPPPDRGTGENLDTWA